MDSSTKHKIKIKVCGSGNEILIENNLILNILNRNFDMEFCDDPDYIICGPGGTHFEHVKYDCVRIMLMTENFSANFTDFDYYIGFDDISFSDRYFRLPYAFQSRDGKPWIPEVISEEKAWNILKSKKEFCNFVYRHPSYHGLREKLFFELNNYKYVKSVGNYLNNEQDRFEFLSNNVNGYRRIEYEDKYKLVADSKFTIAGESVIYPGFETEKIVHPFMYHSIPVYIGSDTIFKDFNRNAFVFVGGENDIIDAVEKVKRLDQNDNEYIKMLMEYPLVDRQFAERKYQELEDFLINIFSQDPQKASRRPRCFYVDSYNYKLKGLYNSLLKKNTPARKRITAIKKRIKTTKRKIKSTLKL